MNKSVALIGFGEAGAAFASAAGWGAKASAFDIAADRKSAMIEAGVIVAADAQSALADAPLILSVVTAEQALPVALGCARLTATNAIWCDMNSVAPATKRQAAQAFETLGRVYIDVAVLAPVHPAQMEVPLLISGPFAEEARRALAAIGFRNVRVVGTEVGQASAIKMIRSVMIKGIEALTDEMMAAAEAAGVRDAVLASLDHSQSNAPWAERAAYNLERMTAHGTRRAAEMDEAAQTLTALGVDPIMTRGTVRRQREAAIRRPISKNLS